MHRSARLMLPLLLQACLLLHCEGASVGVVRVPRVYNILIRSDGALAPSEAVSADSLQSPGSQGGAAPKVLGPQDTQQQEGASDEGQEEGGDEGAEQKGAPELPLLDPKMGAVQEGVNYTEVPLSRAYPLTRYTAPLLAPLSYLTPLHGGLILGPVPRLPLQHEQPQYDQQSLQFDQQPPQRYQPQPFGEPQEPPRQFRPAPLQAQMYGEPQQLPLRLPQQLPRQMRGEQLPRGAFEDEDRDAVGVEAEEDN